MAPALTYRRRAFPWREPPHPFAQRLLPSTDGATTFRSPVAGALLALVADGMLAGQKIRTLQAHYGISISGFVFQNHSPDENERKYQKAIKIAERLAMLGCSNRDSLPYFNAADFL